MTRKRDKGEEEEGRERKRGDGREICTCDTSLARHLLLNHRYTKYLDESIVMWCDKVQGTCIISPVDMGRAIRQLLVYEPRVGFSSLESIRIGWINLSVSQCLSPTVLIYSKKRGLMSGLKPARPGMRIFLFFVLSTSTLIKVDRYYYSTLMPKVSWQ